MGLHDQKFDTFQQWVNKASSWLTNHAEYNNTEHGGSGYRGPHFTAMCFDIKGRRCRNGGDMARARDEGAFPVYWIWPDQALELALQAVSPAPDGALIPGTYTGPDGAVIKVEKM